jgi:hypothetical protein
VVQPEVQSLVRACVAGSGIELSSEFSMQVQGGCCTPNLHELLANTPADVFANVWVQWWHKIPLFHLQYTDLLRLVVLYKY